MKKRFKELWRNIGATGDYIETYNNLVHAYRQPHRYYHNLSHIMSCLELLDEVQELTDTPRTVEFALWFHDIVYKFNADDEQQSAAYAADICSKAGLSKVFNDEVARLILATKHNIKPVSINHKLITDIDLAILGKPAEEYDFYETNIRKEYSFVPESQFRSGRIKVLQSFLNRSSIYSLDHFKNKYQQQAFLNLNRAIHDLSQTC